MHYMSLEREGKRVNRTIREVGRDAQEDQSLDSSGSVLSTFVDSIELRGNNGNREKKKSIQAKQKAMLWSESSIQQLVELFKVHGCEFGIIARKMGKTRSQIKRKFKVLERKHPELADAIFLPQMLQTKESNSLQ